VTILTDIADYPPHTWIERHPGYYICGSGKAVEQARAHGHPPERVFQVSGMILRPHFYSPPQIDTAAERTRLGLNPELPTGLVLFGGHGSDVMLSIAKRIQEAKHLVQLIMMCGHNDPLAAKLKALPVTVPMHVQGFTSEVPYFMQLSDFLIGKPGPGSISEALAMKLPVIVERNAYTLPQERYNTDWVREHRVGVVVNSFRKIAGAVDELLESGRLTEYRSNAGAFDNRAVFEIPDLLEKILSNTGFSRSPGERSSPATNS
jgi:1,2-diacylglycerol 3-beta-galactosyltransferase